MRLRSAFILALKVLYEQSKWTWAQLKMMYMCIRVWNGSKSSAVCATHLKVRVCGCVWAGLKMTLKCHINPYTLNIDTDNTIIIDLRLPCHEMRHHAIYNQNTCTHSLRYVLFSRAKLETNFPGKRFTEKNNLARLKSRFYVHISHSITFKISNPHILSFLMAAFQVRRRIEKYWGKVRKLLKISFH